MTLLVAILLILLVAVVILYLVDRIGLPGNIAWVVKAIVVAVAIWQILVHSGINLPM